jgi:hypothetical protein
MPIATGLVDASRDRRRNIEPRPPRRTSFDGPESRPLMTVLLRRGGGGCRRRHGGRRDRGLLRRGRAPVGLGAAATGQAGNQCQPGREVKKRSCDVHHLSPRRLRKGVMSARWRPRQATDAAALAVRSADGGCFRRFMCRGRITHRRYGGTTRIGLARPAHHAVDVGGPLAAGRNGGVGWHRCDWCRRRLRRRRTRR